MGATASFTIDTHAFRKSIRDLAGDIFAGASDAVAVAVHQAFAEAKDTRLFTDRTGKARMSIVASVSDFNGKVSAGVGVKYMRPLHDGSKPHYITPVNAKALRFRIGNVWISTQLVVHPGTKPRPFITQAGDNAARTFENSARKKTDAAVSKFNARG